MGKLNGNIRKAEEAVEYVDKKMIHGAANHPLPVLKPSEPPWWISGAVGKETARMGAIVLEAVTVGVKRVATGMCVAGVRQSVPPERVSGPWLMRLAQAAESRGCGNCMEQAALAFQYLKTNGVGPLDLIAHLPLEKTDHAFVAIGRVEKDPQKFAWSVEGSTRCWEEELASWGADAAVCDPWWPDKKYRSYPAVRIPKAMKLKDTWFEKWVRWEGKQWTWPE